ncbi:MULTISPECIES: single-stranded-DNA-specific exonuclease RecJ [unclassified Roseofilum]|uniref:single-stranded-DNA-specific exonuclease RecJ n=1 Tax=unclassified Roseofilum TaxID=2620099 RepID=UPI000E89B922|nr:MULTISPECIES: single-stranded-DNA-specific exonuclease RecJ [unclassified Roseofilum]MBP0011097.1 single-stranded-DNA-specific exonuclease RecJ [Roseofilum sp. Belize Diploria]MBP0035558.1 single-stranded-DNA-specific exonuclease RecJ [Roseofilum sp. Belize BBD 4]HBQ99191.1 single-stranded-DNA-specific exonuclease RecJ [Cyanobacteria bacterium UBA11691]
MDSQKNSLSAPIPPQKSLTRRLGTLARLPQQRWQIFEPDPEIESFAQQVNLSPLIAQVLHNRGIQTLPDAQGYLNPDRLQLPHPLAEFPDLENSVTLLKGAIAQGQKIAICGDYDADGMTSTALLLRSLKYMGAQVDYAIPSRMSEGYGINRRIVEDFHQEGVKIILTVDNGIAAYDPIVRAVELGLTVIITDHHELPSQLPPARAILNPKLLPNTSPYASVAGVGVAYILAITLAQELGQAKALYPLCLELFTLGTIADLAPLTGVNRRWLKRGLRRLPHSELAGVQALIQVSGVSDRQKSLKPEDIGFRLGPRINAIGRLSDPQIVIELLTTDEPGLALEQAMKCEQINRRRQELCEQITQEAIDIIQTEKIPLYDDRVLVLVQPGWHHGVIGIVASRLVERYGVPVFLGTYEDEDRIRGSARGIPEFHVFEALEYCDALLEKYGGHKAAGGFSLPSQNLERFKIQLSDFSHQCLQPQWLKPLIRIDGLADFSQLDLDLYGQIDRLHPCGIENDLPIFWTPDVRILEQKIVGKGHIKLTLNQEKSKRILKAIAWRWQDYFPLPSRLDIAYSLRENTWNGNTSLELELVGVRLQTHPD